MCLQFCLDWYRLSMIGPISSCVVSLLQNPGLADHDTHQDVRCQHTENKIDLPPRVVGQAIPAIAGPIPELNNCPFARIPEEWNHGMRTVPMAGPWHWEVMHV